MKTELLAPAGDIEAGYAALFYGADAVYLGLQQFSARATATNFSEENLNEFVGYAHHLGRKVYAAVNTLVQRTFRFAEKSGYLFALQSGCGYFAGLGCGADYSGELSGTGNACQYADGGS